MDNNSSPPNEITYRHQHSITMLELQIQIQSEEFVSAESKAQQYITVSSIVIAVISGFAINEWETFQTPEKLFLVLFGVFSFGVILFCLKSLQHRTWRAPVNLQEFDKILDVVKHGNDIPYYEGVFTNYRQIIEKNYATLETKRLYVRRAERAVCCQLITLVLLAIIAILV